MADKLPNDLVERVLDRLGLSSRPEVSLAGLSDLYGAWCRRVPFDNIRKLIHVRAGNPTTLPGDTPNEFFEAWLAHGTGATCWAGNGALCDLLATLGYDARRAAATMMVAPGIPPNHGSVVVHFGDARYVTDASMLFVEPLPLRDGVRIPHPAWGVDARVVDGFFTIRWNAIGTPITGESRQRFLVDEIGISEEIADLVPDDVPMPPPPGSRSAAAA